VEEQKALVALPLYKLMSSQFFTNWIKMDQSHVSGIVTVDGAYITTSMEMIVDQALANDGWDRLIIIEHDMIPPPWAFTRMAMYEPEWAIVGSIYFAHPPPHNVHIYVERDDGDDVVIGSHDVITPDTVRAWTEEPALHRCDGVGFGLISIARHVLEDWDSSKPMFGTSGQLGSHDLWFCRRAREQGHKVYVDSAVVCDHLTEIGVGLSDNQAHADTVDYQRIIEFEYSDEFEYSEG
jgi:hypothetical protein